MVGKTEGWDRGKTLVVLVSLVLTVLLLRPHLQRYDSVGYYSWVRSLVINGDLNIGNDFEKYDASLLLIKNTKTGIPGQPYAVGSAILWLPFFLIAHGFVIIANHLGFAISADGYSLPYRFLVSCGTAVYGTLGLLILYNIVREYYDASIAIISVMTIWLASPLFFYMFANPLKAHANDMFAYTLVLWAWLASRREPAQLLPYALLGGAAGLAALVRNQNAALAVLIILFIGYQVIKGFLTLGQGCLRSLVFSVAWWITFFPQLYVWHCTIGNWLLLRTPYSYIPGTGEFHTGFPWVLHVLFSDNRGLFIWHPVLLLTLPGWCFLYRKDKLLAAFLTLSFLIQLGIVGSWDQWHGARAFGQRFFVNLEPAFSLGFAALLHTASARISLKTIIAVCVAFIIWNFLLMLQFIAETVPRDGPTDIWTLVKNQFLIIPTYFDKLLKGFITRSE